MKKILVVTAVLVLALGAMSCGQTQTPPSQPYTPAPIQTPPTQKQPAYSPPPAYDPPSYPAYKPPAPIQTPPTQQQPAYASSYTEAEVIKLCKDELQKLLPQPLVEQDVFVHAFAGRWSATWKPTERRWLIKSELAQPYNWAPELGEKGLIGSLSYYYYEHLKSWEGPSLTPAYK